MTREKTDKQLDPQKATGLCAKHGNFPARCPQCLKDRAQEGKEQQEKLDAFFEVLLMKAQFVNEGNHGLIARVDTRTLDPDIREAIFGTDVIPDASAIKLLKVYKPPAGKQEYEAQVHAHRVLTQAVCTDCASIPQAYHMRDVAIRSDDAQLALRRLGMKEGADRVELILMDFVDGVDLATVLYREVIERHPQLVHLKKDVDRLPFPDLQAEVAAALGYQRPGGKSWKAHERAFEQEEVYDQNAEKLYAFLERSGFTIPPTVRAQVEKTMRLLHTHGIYHRDLHPRNVMITPQGTSIIDFGSALIRPGQREAAADADIYIEDDKRYVQDESILFILKRFETSYEEKRRTEQDAFFTELNDLRARLEKTRGWQEFMGQLTAHDTVSDHDIDALVTPLTSGLVSGLELQKRGIALLEIAKRNPATVLTFIDKRVRAKNALPVEMNFLLRIAKKIKKPTPLAS